MGTTASPPRPPSALRRLLDMLYLGAGLLAGLFLVTVFLLMLALSAGRQVGVNVPDGTDFAAWSMVAMSFLGLAHTFKSGDLIRVGLLLDRFKGRTRQAMELFALTISGAFTAYFTWYSVQLTYDSWKFLDMSQGVLAVPLWIPQSGMAIGLAILLVSVVDEIIRVARGQRPSYEKVSLDESPEEFVERLVASSGGA